MTTHRLIQAVVLAAFLFSTSLASAESKVEKAFRVLKAQRAQGDGPLLLILSGAASALMSVNAQLSVSLSGRDPLFCVPKDLSLNSYNYADIALQEFERRPEWYRHEYLEAHPNDAVVDALVIGMEVTFPCK